LNTDEIKEFGKGGNVPTHVARRAPSPATRVCSPKTRRFLTTPAGRSLSGRGLNCALKAIHNPYPTPCFKLSVTFSIVQVRRP
jgi:hypothetical protein